MVAVHIISSGKLTFYIVYIASKTKVVVYNLLLPHLAALCVRSAHSSHYIAAASHSPDPASRSHTLHKFILDNVGHFYYS